MSLVKLLQENYFEIVEKANEHLHRAHLDHYCNSPRQDNINRINNFLDLMIGSIDRKDLTALIDYTKITAKERFDDGFDLCEVLRALNGLKKVIWEKVVNNFTPEKHANALGLINTVIDEAKDCLANNYILYSINFDKTEKSL